ncbi:MAG: hypothetical protein R3E97_13980, partial [Candidatus Eisenbacteria bacterium]
GLEYDALAVTILDFGSCGDFELPSGEWPAPGEGTAVTWSEAQTTPLTHVYAFAGYNYAYYGADVSFDLAPHPTQGGFFADDSVPSILDPIADFGRLGFGNNPGYLPCPAEPADGACCLSDGTCDIRTESDCLAQDGSWQGAEVPCDPNPCEPVPVLETTWGGIKAAHR